MIVLSLFDTCLVTWPALRDNRNMDLKTYVSNLRITKVKICVEIFSKAGQILHCLVHYHNENNFRDEIFFYFYQL